MSPNLATKLQQLRGYLASRAAGGIALAFSGGVDSSVLLALLQEQGQKLLALYAHSPLHAGRERGEVQAAAGSTPLHIEELAPLQIPQVRHNTRERCYHCKLAIFSRLKTIAQAQGLAHLLDGTNADDLLVYRPGRRALQELGILSPLAELAISKAEVREIAKELGLVQTSTKPSAPCLATRFDYDTELTEANLRQVEEGEKLLRRHLAPTSNLRLRVHGQLARIEVDPADWQKILQSSPTLLTELRQLGYNHVTLDLAGFRSGSMDRNTLNYASDSPPLNRPTSLVH